MASSTYDPVSEAFAKAKTDFIRDLEQTKGRKLRDKLTQDAHTPESVWKYIEDLQKDQGNRRCLQGLSRIGPYLQRLEEYSRVIEVFVQVKPEILALIWGPIKLLLQMTSNVTKSFDAILDAMKTLGPALPDFSKFRDMFRDNPRLKHVLSLYFTDILEFYLTSLKFFSNTKAGFVFEAVWPTIKAKIDVTVKNIEKHASLFCDELTLTDIAAAHEFRKKSLSEFEEMRDSRERRDFDSLEGYISPPNYDSRLTSIDMDHCEGTGAWLLADQSFIRWLDPASKSENVLWLQGIPGAGKTYLAATVTHETRKRENSLSVFLRYDQDRETYLPIIHALIFQLAASDRDLKTVLCASILYGAKEFKKELRTDSQFALDTFSKLLRCAGTTYMIIDGLDETNETVQAILLQKLLALAKDHAEMRLLISSRVGDRIDRLLGDQSMLIKVQERNSGSIQKFIRLWTKDWLTESTFVEKDRATIQQLLAPLAAQSNGMFLYARIVLNSIRFLQDIESIRKELVILPESLDEAYARIIQRINELPETARRNSKRILGWIAFSSYLTRREMEQALLITHGSTNLGRVQAKLNHLQLCGPLVEVQDEQLVFVHFTVKEYLVKNQSSTFISQREAVLDLATTCLTYLCMDIFDIDNGDYDDDDDINELGDYDSDRSEVSSPSSDILETDIMSGTYRLHGFAYSQWTSLVRKTIDSYRGDPIPESLIQLLKQLSDQRVREHIDSSDDNANSWKLDQLKSRPDVQIMLSRSMKFHSNLRASMNWRLDDTNASWTRSDPTTLSTSAILIHQAVEKLACPRTTHDPKCHKSCRLLSEHYGSRIFKCRFVACPFQRLGFTSRSDRDRHVQYHLRPFKCPVTSCEYADIGFLSQEQRDTHWFTTHYEPPHPDGHEHAQNFDKDEIAPLLFDLVRKDQVEAVRKFLPYFNDANSELKLAIWTAVAVSGSVPMAKLLGLTPSSSSPGDNIKIAIEAQNIPITRLLCETYSINLPSNLFFDDGITHLVMKSDSSDLFEIWQRNVVKHKKPNEILRSSSLVDTKLNPIQETRLAAFWREQHSSSPFTKRKLSEALKALAQRNCSPILAKVLLQSGANAQGYQKSPTASYLTPLHCAAKKTTENAAQLIRLLLLAGADPNVISLTGKGGRNSRTPSMEKGAKGISKWLGMNWEELVSWAQEERKRAGLTDEEEDKGKLPPGW